MAGIKPNEFNVGVPTSSTELYTQTGGTNNKFTVEAMWIAMTQFTDADGFDYGTTFEEYTSSYPELGGSTIVGGGTYYKDPNPGGSYYEDFVLNLNTPQFGGDGTSLIPIWLKYINDSVNFVNMTMSASQGDMQFVTQNTLTTGRGGVLVDDNGVDLYFSNSVDSTQASIALNSNNININSTNNDATSATAMTISASAISMQWNDPLSDITNYISVENIGTSVEMGFYGNIISTGSNGYFRMILDPADVAQPLRFNITGLNSYADEATAKLAGLNVGDLFLIGTALNVVVTP